LRKLDRRYSSQFMKTQVCHGFLSRRPDMMLCRRPAISVAQIHIYASWTTTWPLLYGNHNSVVTLNNPKILPQRLHYRLYSKPDVPLNCKCTTSHHILSGLGNWRNSESRYLMGNVSSSGSSKFKKIPSRITLTRRWKNDIKRAISLIFGEYFYRD